MSEFDELAEVIYDQDKKIWPINWREAKALAYLHHPTASQQFIDNLADAIMRVNHAPA